MKPFFLLTAFLSILLQSGLPEKSESTKSPQDSLTEAIPSTVDTSVFESVAPDSMNPQAESDAFEEINPTYSTAIRFPDYKIVLHGFGSSYENTQCISVFQDNHEEYIESEMQEESEEKEVEEIAQKDTAYLSEDLDVRINNTLIEIIPKDSNDAFIVSMGYMTLLSEIIDDRNHTSEEIGKFYENWKPINETTKFVVIKDSANYFFRALPHTADMEEVTVVDGEVVPVKERNTEEQVNSERRFHKEESDRIKHKYKLKDTIVVIPGEYDTVASLTKDGRLYGYHYDAFLFRIDRYHGKKKIDTKYVRIYIAYGC